jgi:amino acid adenylation domain-containing protein
MMEMEPDPKTPTDSFWKSIVADHQSAGLLPENSFQGVERTPVYNAEIRVPLSKQTLALAPTRTDTVLRAAWAVALARHTANTDIFFLSSFNERKPWLAPIRPIVPPQRTVADWLLEFDQSLRQAEAHGPVPPTLLAQASDEGLLRSCSTFLIIPPRATAFPPRDQIRGPLLFLVRLDLFEIEIHYDSTCFDHTEVKTLADHVNIVLDGMAAKPDSQVGNLPMLTATERTQLLDKWNDTSVPFAENTCIHQFFEEQVARTPEAVAVVFCDQQWTYRELNTQAEALAASLRSSGVAPGSFVAICLNRSLELMAMLFAVFKAGAAYIPLDPSYPAERLTFMIDDAKPTVIVVSKETENLFPLPGQRLFHVDGAGNQNGHIAQHKTPVPQESSDAAYVLYTSGSTGKPKGVIVTHRNVSNFFTAMDAVIGIEPGVWLGVTSVNFDISVFELFWTLARGFRLILQEEGQWASKSGSKYSLPEQMRRHGVTHLQCTPSLASMLICDSDSVNALRPLKRFMVGGEPLPLDLAHRLADIIAGDLFNLYGPTETTVWSAAQHIGRQEPQILIGRPVANTQLYVLDPQRELVPIGSAGELYIGGDGLAVGYLNRPDLTQERFITHAFSPVRTERLYRTGDLVRYTLGGRLEFMGRIDQQIKIRGVRIELGEIEVVLREHPEVRDAAVVVLEHENDDKRLVAYLVASTPLQPPAAVDVQQWLGTKLPKMLVPSALVFLSEFPKTPNGKLDRRALPKPDQKVAEVVEGSANDLERQIAAAWCAALGVQTVGIEERFFDIGGHSLLMVEVHDLLREKTGHNVALLDLFQYPTIRSLAHYLNHRPQKKITDTSGLNRGKLRQQLAARQKSLRKSGPLGQSS